MRDEQRTVLAYVVIDPDAWWTHVQRYTAQQWEGEQAEFDALDRKLASGQQIDPRQKARLKQWLMVSATERAQKMLADKVARWTPEFARESAKPGYKPRAERDWPIRGRKTPFLP